jgi:hypothetical protein
MLAITSLGGVFGRVSPLESGSLCLAALGKILTLDNSIKQQVIVVDWYCMCKRVGNR